MSMERTPATRAVAAAMSARFGASPPPRYLPSASFERDDQWIECDDVGHREEGNYSASDLLSY